MNLRSTKRAALAALALAFALAPAQAYFVPRHQAAWPALANSGSYTPACQRLTFPNGVASETTEVTFLGHTMCVAPNYSVSQIRVLFANFYVNNTGANNPELCPGNPVTIDYATIFIGGVGYPLTFGGAESIKIDNCKFVWSDPLVNSSHAIVTIAANATYYVRVSRTLPASGNQVVGAIPAVNPLLDNANAGDGFNAFTAPQASYRTSGTVSDNNGEGNFASAPAMIVGQGWDGSAVYALAGDSIGYGQNDTNYNSPYVSGAEMRAFADSGSGLRNFLPLVFPGTKPDDQSSIASGQYQLRMQALRSIGNVPFNEILSQMGQNATAIAGTSLPAFQASMENWWRFWRDYCPACTIFQVDFPAHAGALNNTHYTTLADQTTDYPSGMRWIGGGWIAANVGLPSNVVGIDLTNAFTAGAPSPFITQAGLWPIDSAWTGTFVSWSSRTLVVNSSNGAPPLGANLVFEPGSSNSEVNYVIAVTGTGPYTITVSAGPGKTHASGSAVALACTYEGTHPCTLLYQAAANALIALKQSGVLP